MPTCGEESRRVVPDARLQSSSPWLPSDQSGITVISECAFLAVGWVGDRLYSVIFEAREDEEGEILHLVTLWRSTKEEIRLYEENS
jgi:hypothetical protein